VLTQKRRQAARTEIFRQPLRRAMARGAIRRKQLPGRLVTVEILRKRGRASADQTNSNPQWPNPGHEFHESPPFFPRRRWNRYWIFAGL
jgi:hypothetical protein